MDIMGALAAAAQGLQTIKALREIDNAIDVAEWKAKLAEVQVALSDAKMTLQEAKEEIAEKDKEISRVLSTIKRREELALADGFYYLRKPDGRITGKPFCPLCLEEKGRLVHLARIRKKDGDSDVCPRCKADFGFIP